MPTLPRYQLTTTARSIGELVRLAATGDIDLDPPYQRGHVWGTPRRRQLLKSLRLGIPIPALVMNDRLRVPFSAPGYVEDRDAAYAMVDGKQRLTSLVMFCNNEFGVPHEWFDSDDHTQAHADDVYWDDLTIGDQRKFFNTPIAVIEGALPTLNDERAVFDLINFGGVAQGDTDVDDQPPPHP